MVTTTIARLDEAQLESLVGEFPRRGAKHRDRLRLQQAGKATYLVAWDDGRAVGHALLKLPAAVVGVGRRFGCAEVEDLFVADDRRRLGIGDRLLEACESAAADSGVGAVGLGVGVENAAARRLYDRRGYEQTDDAPFVLAGTVTDADGVTHHWQETCVYLVKRL